MEISSTADWQGCLLAFNKLDQAFEMINAARVTLIFSATVFPLVSSKFNWTRTQGESTQKKRQGAKWNRTEDALVTRELNCCSTATPCLAHFLKSRVVDHV